MKKKNGYLHIRIPESDVKVLKKAARRENISVSVLVRYWSLNAAKEILSKNGVAVAL